jgi:hypothetical protein
LFGGLQRHHDCDLLEELLQESLVGREEVLMFGPDAPNDRQYGSSTSAASCVWGPEASGLGMRYAYLILALAACASVQMDVVQLTPVAPLPAVAPESVSILTAPPTTPYTEIALLTANGNLYAKGQDVVRALQIRAGRMGANAIVLVYVQQGVDIALVTDDAVMPIETMRGRALAIRVP